MDRGGDYRPQIDGLRALAMVGVLYVHFWDATPLTEYIRVTLFFVVSGFLVTHLLISAREKGGELNIANFYIRRALRLFPALWLMLAVAWAVDADGFRQSWAWHVLPLSNVYFSLHERVSPWVLGHLWSLNVLEQFYLIWPLVVLLLPRAGVYVVTVLLYAALVIVQTNADSLGISGWWRFFVFSADPIFVGALACLLMREPPVRAVLTSLWWLPLALAVLASPLFAWEGYGHSQTYRLLSTFAVAILVAGAYRGYPGLAGRALQSRAAVALSQISYGVYIYHLLLWYLVVQVWPDLFDKNGTTFLVMTALSLAVATLSWHLFEKPLGRLKDRFPTLRRPAPTSGTDSQTAPGTVPRTTSGTAA